MGSPIASNKNRSKNIRIDSVIGSIIIT